MKNIERFCRNEERTAYQSGDVFSLLFTAINSGQFWRCIRWCDKGTTVIITSPINFENHVLRREEWKQQLKVQDFVTFLGFLQQVGFEKVSSQRPSKVQKFRHPDFKKDNENLQKLVNREEKEKTKRKRRISEAESVVLRAVRSVKDQNRTGNQEQKVKLQRMVALDDNNTSRRGKKRKRSDANGDEMSTHCKKQKPIQLKGRDAGTHNTPREEQLRKSHSADEMAAVQALLSLAKPELLAAQSFL